MPNCKRCSKNIANRVAVCSTCNNQFHPGCVPLYLAIKTSNQCCTNIQTETDTTTVSKLNSAVNAANVRTAARQMSHNQVRDISLMEDEVMESTVTTEEFKGMATQEQQTTMFEMLRRIETSNKTQTAVLDDHTALLNELKSELMQQKLRIGTLEAENAALRGEVNQLNSEVSHFKELQLDRRSNSEFKVIGVPKQATQSNSEIIKKLLGHIKLDSQLENILEIRDLIGRQNVEPSSQSNAIRDTKAPFVVLCNSSTTRSFIVKTSKKDGPIKFKALFPEYIGEATVSLYEMLPTAVHKIRVAAKERAVAAKYNYVWSSEGTVYARKEAKAPRIPIVTPTDVNKMA